MHIRHSPRDVALALLLVLIGVPAILIAAALAAFLLFPPPVGLPQPQAATLAQTSHIYAGDGTLLASLHAQYNREPVALNQMALTLQQATVASEDSRFFQNSGIDVRGIFRALLADLRARSAVQGASTIAEQYVKQAYTGSQRSLFRKFRQALLAAQLERTYSKDTILESYLNTVYFGDGAYGVEAAAQTYFGVHASQLTLPESALLVGVIPSPGRYSPTAHPAAAEARRKAVLDRMLASGYITAAQAAQAKAAPPELVSNTNVQVVRFPWFVDAVQTYLISKYGKDKVFSGGLEVYTSLDPAQETAAQNVLSATLPAQSDPDYALVSVDPATGYVTSLIGGRTYVPAGFNIAINGRRQPGSSFKPFTLVAALEQGISPHATFNGPSTICLAGWKPDCHVSNFGNEAWGTISLTDATVNSVNTVYAQLVLQVGPGKVVSVANAMGIPGPAWLPARSGCTRTASNPCGTLLTPLPSITLGAEEVTPLEMASAYATLAAGGTYRAPKLVTKVIDASGAVLEAGPSAPVQAIPPEIAYTATTILQQVIQRGTGTAAAIGRPAAGKTGTASDYKNAWFVGYTPNDAAAVWMGYEESNQPMLNVHGVGQVTGGTLPAKMWSAYMGQVLAGTPPLAFSPPPLTNSGPTFQLPAPPAPSPVPSPSPTATVTATPTATPAPFPSALPIPSVSPLPSPRPSPSPSPSPEETPSVAPSDTSSPSPSPTRRHGG